MEHEVLDIVQGCDVRRRVRSGREAAKVDAHVVRADRQPWIGVLGRLGLEATEHVGADGLRDSSRLGV